MNIKWTPAEMQFIRNNAGTMTDKTIAEKLTISSNRKVTLDAVRKKRQKLGIKKVSGRGYCKIKVE